MTLPFPPMVCAMILVATVLSMVVIMTIENTRLRPTARLLLSGLALMAILYAAVGASVAVLNQRPVVPMQAEKEDNDVK